MNNNHVTIDLTVFLKGITTATLDQQYGGSFVLLKAINRVLSESIVPSKEELTND